MSTAMTACGPSIQPLRPRPPTVAVIDLPPAAERAGTASEREYFRIYPLMVPVDGVRPEQLRDSFNDARNGGRTHQALDIPARRGTPVLAATAGTVIRLAQTALGGTTLYVSDERRRFVHYYAHLDRYASGMVEGRRVEQGDVLGYVGTTGNAPPNAPHLHFQALRADGSRRDWWNGAPVDVRPFFVLAGKVRAL